MLRERVREGVRSGFVAAAATAGILLGFGFARQAAMRPINSVAHILIGSRAYYMVGADWLVTPLALLVHFVVICAAGTLLAALTAHVRGAAMYVIATAYAVGLWMLVELALPERVRPGFESGLSNTEILVIYVVMALVLAWTLATERTTRAVRAETLRDSGGSMEPGN